MNEYSRSNHFISDSNKFMELNDLIEESDHSLNIKTCLHLNIHFSIRPRIFQTVHGCIYFLLAYIENIKTVDSRLRITVISEFK